MQLKLNKQLLSFNYCLHRVLHGLIKRETKNDGVKALKLFRKHYLEELNIEFNYALCDHFLILKLRIVLYQRI